MADKRERHTRKRPEWSLIIEVEVQRRAVSFCRVLLQSEYYYRRLGVRRGSAPLCKLLPAG